MKALIISFLLLIASGTTLWMILPSPGVTAEQAARMRGSDAYYETSGSMGKVGEMVVRLGGERERHLLLDFHVGFRPGLEMEDPDEYFERYRPYLRSQLLMLLSDENHAELESLPGRFRFKRKLRALSERVLFPDGQGRVRHIYLDKLLVQKV